MRGRLVRVVAAAVAALWLAGCEMTSSYNPGYLSAARRPAAVEADSKVLVITATQEEISKATHKAL